MGHSKGCWDDSETEQDCGLLTEAFPIRGTSPAKPKPTSTESPDAIALTVSEARSFPTVQNAKQGAKQVQGKGENRTSWVGVNNQREQEPQGGEACVPQVRREDGLTSTPRQLPWWRKRGGWGKVTMISRSVEISIAGGGGEMVHVQSLARLFFFFFFVFL